MAGKNDALGLGIGLTEDEEFSGGDLAIHHTGAYPEESVRWTETTD